MEKKTIIILSDILRNAGYSDDQIDLLLAAFLEEEAFGYVEAMKKLDIDQAGFEKPDPKKLN